MGGLDEGDGVKVSETLDEVLRIVSHFPNTELEDDPYERGHTPSIGGDSPDSPMEFQLSVQTSDFESFRKERRLFFPSSETVTSSLHEAISDLDNLEKDLDLDIEKQAEIQKYVQDVTDSVIALQNMENLDVSSPSKSPRASPTSPSRFAYSPHRPASLGVSPRRESTSTFDVSPQAKEMFNVNTGIAVVNQKHTIILKSHSSEDEEGSRNDSYVSQLKMEIDNTGRISVDEDSFQSGDGIPSDVAEVSYSEVFSDSEVSFGRLENETGQDSSTPQQQSLPLSRTSLSDIESESSEDQAVYQYKLKEAKMTRINASLTDTSSSNVSSSDEEKHRREEDDDDDDLEKGELDRHAGGLMLSPDIKAGTGKELFADLHDPPSPVFPDASANSDDFD
ncbi:uncharacterized protein [Apostichopus japonicus]|uniref:uncharacterized protein n=1 Tax=Stichopus japonicus TaxID=307972 RepID=UPI003AB36010